MNAVLQAGQIATSLVDGHLTRNAIGALGDQIAANHTETMEAITALGQSVRTVGALTMLTAGGQLLNLAMTAATFRIIIQRLDKLSSSIDELGQKILAEFNRDRDMRFKVALQAARDAFESQQEASRNAKAYEASLGLYEARENFFTDLDNLLKNKPNRDHLLLAQHLLIRAMYAETSRIRCYVISGERDLAKTYFSEDITRFGYYTKKLIELWIGNYPAIYFHKDVPEEYLDRFLYIQQWLKGATDENKAIVMFQIINEMREQFWDNSVLRGGLVDKIKRRYKDTQLAELSEGLAQAELLIENYERLEGFDLEIRSMRLSFDEWSNYVTEENLEKHGGALIVDDEIEEQYAHLMA